MVHYWLVGVAHYVARFTEHRVPCIQKKEQQPVTGEITPFSQERFEDAFHVLLRVVYTYIF